MIIFLYGSDTYRLKEKSREIILAYKQARQSGLNFRYFDSKKLNYQDFEEQFWQRPMLEEKKLFVVENIFSQEEFKHLFLAKAPSFLQSEDIILIQQEGEVSAQDPLFAFLKKKAKTQQFLPLQGQKLRNWIKKEFLKYAAKVELEAIEKLIAYAGHNLWQLANEIKKLSAFKQGERITPADVQLLVKPKFETDIFKTIDAIASKDKKSALSLLHRHLEKGDSHLYLLAMINFQFRHLLQIKSGARLKAHPYLIKKTSQQARLFSLPELKKIYQRLFEIDYQIKTGRLDPATALDLLIAEI